MMTDELVRSLYRLLVTTRRPGHVRQWVMTGDNFDYLFWHYPRILANLAMGGPDAPPEWYMFGLAIRIEEGAVAIHIDYVDTW